MSGTGVQEIREHKCKRSKRQYEILVLWKGLEPSEDTWESLVLLARAIPVMVALFESTTRDTRFPEAIAAISRNHRE